MRIASGNALIHWSGCDVSPIASGRIASCTTATAPAAIRVARLRYLTTSQTPSGATRKPAKKCVRTAAAEATAHHTRLRRDGSLSERANSQNDSPHRTVNSM